MTTKFKPKNPAFADRVRLGFSKQPMQKTIGTTLGEVKPGYCEIHLDLDPKLTQHHGYLHGGAYAFLADTAGGYAAYTLIDEDESALTVEYKLNMLRPGKGQSFVAKGQVIQQGRQLSIVEVKIYSIEDGEKKLCVISLQTIMIMANLPDNSTKTRPKA